MKSPYTRISSISLEEFSLIIEHLRQYRSTHARDTVLLGSLGLNLSNYKKLHDRLAYMELHGFLTYYKDGRKNAWRLKADKEHILTQLTNTDITNLDYAMELGREYFTKDTQEVFKKIFASDPKLLGKFRMFEEIQSERLHDKIEKLLGAIEHRYYIDITLHHDTCGINDYREIKPVKIVFVDDNWYLAFEYRDQEGRARFRLGRIAFVGDDIRLCKDFRYSNKNTFQTTEIQKYIEFLQNDLQNAMTLYGKKRKTARLKAQGFISQYFKPDMKPFLSSQKFVEELPDGSIVFTVEYTQDLEVLPFIQKWMPDLIILEPKSLKEAYTQKLQKALSNLS